MENVITTTTDERGQVTHTFPSGITLTTYPNDRHSTGVVEYPRNGEVGPISIPVRFTGDVFHALRMGLSIPRNCLAC
jgi:hypothetical protein